jgi:anti-sigma-K factor RskA
MRDHVRIEELLTLEALDAIDDGERHELDVALTAHGSDCADCLALLAELRQTSGLLAFALDPVHVPEHIEAEAIRRVRALDERVSAQAPRSRTALVALAIAAAVLVAAIVGTNSTRQGGGSSGDLAAILAEPGARLIHLQGSGGNVAVAVSGDSTQAFVAGTDLAQLPDGKVYEVWSIAGDTPTSLACLPVVDGSISGAVHGDVTNADVVAVTVEDASCPTAPTTQPILNAQMS